MFVIEERETHSFLFFVFCLCMCFVLFFLALRIETGVNTRTGVDTEFKKILGIL